MTTKMSSDNLNTDRCPKCGVLMTDCTDYQSENERLRAALKPFAEIELWRDTYPDGPDIFPGEQSHRLSGTLIKPQHVHAARDAYQQSAGGKE